MSWNVQGVNIRRLPSFIDQLSQDIRWDVCCLQEFASSQKPIDLKVEGGHLCFANPPREGQRRAAILVHARVAHLYVADSFTNRGRSGSIDMRFDNRGVRIITAHLDPSQSKADFDISLDDLDQLTKARGKAYHCVIGADLEDSLGPSSDDIDPKLIGPFAMVGKSWKRDKLVEWVHSRRLRALNTMSADESGSQYTCHYYLKRPAHQIDAILSSWQRGEAATFETTATASDHRPLHTYIPTRAETKQEMKRERKQSEVTQKARPKKPIGWICNASVGEYNDLIRRKLVLPLSLSRDEVFDADAFHIYTDGSRKLRRRKSAIAGWGFLIFDTEPNREVKELLEDNTQPKYSACGPVILDHKHPYFIGATGATNNTGELSGVVEVLLFLSSLVREGAVKEGTKVVFHTDSLYVLGLLTGKFAAKENKILVHLMLHLWRRLQEKIVVRVSWVKAHSGIYGNEVVDKLAKRGTEEENEGGWWRRPFDLGDWGEEDFLRGCPELSTNDDDTQINNDSLDGLVPTAPPPKRRRTFPTTSTTTNSSTFSTPMQTLSTRFDLTTTQQRPPVRKRRRTLAPIPEEEEEGGEDVERFDEGGNVVQSISEITRAISEAGAELGSARCRKRFVLPNDDLDLNRLNDLMRLRRLERDPILRHNLSNEIVTVRRKVRRKVLDIKISEAIKYNKPGANFKKKDSGTVEILVDESNPSCLHVRRPEAKAKVVEKFFADLFHDPLEVSLPGWILRRWTMDDLAQFPRIDGNLIRMVLNMFAGGKSGGEDLIVIEMMTALDEELLEYLARAFQFRLIYHYSEDGDDCWTHHFVTLVRKVIGAKSVSQFRPIALLAAIYKIYSRLLLLLSGDLLSDLFHQYAFRKFYQADEIIFILRSLVEKALEWDVAVYIYDGDIYKAYDHTRYSTVIKGCLKKKVPKILIAAWLRELVKVKTSVRLDSQTTTEPIRRTRSLVQGDPAAPALFNTALDLPAREFGEIAKDKGWGYRLPDETFVNLLLFADNFWLIGTSAREISEMSTVWINLLEKYGWHVPLDECSYGTTLTDDFPSTVTTKGIQIRRVRRAEGFKVLGVQLTFDGRQTTELQRREVKAWAAFFRSRDLLCNRGAALNKRFEMLDRLVGQSYLWGPPSWNLSKIQYEHVNALENAMARKMVNPRRRPNESLPDFMVRSNHILKEIRQRLNRMSWVERIHKKYFNFAGHLSRMATYDKFRMSHRILKAFNWEYLCHIASQNKGSQTHSQRFKVWRWERSLYVFYDRKPGAWEKAAEDRISWQQRLEEMVSWRVRNR